MTTLIAVYNSDGLVGRCDAKCYQATEPACECICGGDNHGAGYARAVDDTRDRSERWLEEARARGWTFDRTELGVPAAAEALFHLEGERP